MKDAKNLKASFYGIFPLMKGKNINPDIISEEFSKLLSINKKIFLYLKSIFIFILVKKVKKKTQRKNFG